MKFLTEDFEWTADPKLAKIFEEKREAKEVAAEVNGIDLEHEDDGYHDHASFYVDGAQGWLVVKGE